MKQKVIATLIDHEDPQDKIEIWELAQPGVQYDTVRVSDASYHSDWYEVETLRPNGWTHLIFGDREGRERALIRAVEILWGPGKAEVVFG